MGLGALLWGVVLLGGQVCREVGEHVGRFTIRALVLVVFVVLWVRFGFHAAFGYSLWIPILLGAWWALGRSWPLVEWIGCRAGHAMPARPVVLDFDRWMGRRLRGAWRRWRLYEKRWKKTMRGMRLSEINALARDDYPKLKRVVESSVGNVDILTVKILPSQTWEDYNPDALTKAFKARSCDVFDEPGTDFVRLELGRGADPLSELVPLPAIPGTARDVDLSGVPVGVTGKGLPWTVPVRGEHVLIAGMMGSGKSSVLQGLLRGMAPAIREGLVEVWAVDPKRGMELGPASALFARYEHGDIKGIAKLLDDAVKVMQARGDRLTELGLRAHVPTVEEPLIILVIDEFLSLADLAHGDRDLVKSIDSSLRLLLGQGRAPGVTVVGATLDARVKEMPMRKLFSARIALALQTKAEADTILGPEAAKMGARCDRIPRSLRGVGFVWQEGWQGPIRVRAAYVDDDEIRRVAAEYACPKRDEEIPVSPAPAKALKPAEPSTEEFAAIAHVETVEAADDVLAELDAATDWMLPVLDERETVTRTVTIVVPDVPPSMNDPKVKRARKRNPKGGWIPSGREQAENAWKAKFAKELGPLHLDQPLARVGPLRGAMVFTFDDRYGRDLDNYWIAVKGLGDAVVRAGLVPNDRPESWTLSQSIDPESRKGAGKRTTVTLEWDEPLS